MWTKTYDRNGKLVEGGWQIMKEEIKREHQPVVMMEMLTPQLNSAGRFILPTAVKSGSNQFQNVVTDGRIDIDFERGTRRTGELTILNPTAEFTPRTAGFESSGPWAGLIYINRVVRIYRGINSAHGELYIPVGTFFIDVCEIIVEENMSLVNLTLSDFWKKLTKSYLANSRKFEKGSMKNALIKDFINASGIPMAGKFASVIDRLQNRTDAGRKLGKNLKFNRGDNRGEILMNLSKDWNIDMYFDPMGVFNTEDRRSDRSKRLVWTFESKAIDNKGQHGGIVSLKRSFSDDNLYNNVILVGTGKEKQTFIARRKVTNKASNFHEDKIGNRIFFKESDNWSTQGEVDAALKRIWAKRIQFSEVITAEVVCNPALDADDKIRITERDYAKVDDTYRLSRLNVPLVTSRQEIEATNLIRDEDLWDG